jgi:hypothetical protein
MIGRSADGDKPDTKLENECAGEDCGSFVLSDEEYCMSCSGDDNE